MSENMPIPARFMRPWIADNAAFIDVLGERNRVLGEAKNHRPDNIRTMEPGARAPLAAVDAAVADVSIGDLMSVLIQVVHITDDGTTTFTAPIRLTGLSGMEISLARGPARMAAEYTVLAASGGVTIADTSFWSGLMDLNQAICAYKQEGVINNYLEQAYHTLVTEQRFLETLRNPHVIAMSKLNQSHNYSTVVSDREFLGQALNAGEFLAPAKLSEALHGEFGVEKRGFTNAEREEIKDIYKTKLGVTYFKPHAWSRAFRIEAHLRTLTDDAWLMPLLNALHYHTLTRTVEPWPQFMTDWTSKHISAVTTLYGMLNFHRVPVLDPARTRIPQGYK